MLRDFLHRDPRHGPLPALLLLLTAAAGAVDAVTYLRLGHVFVANMTGNIVLLGFAGGGMTGLSVSASLLALGAFVAGSIAGGRLGIILPMSRGHLFAATAALTAVLAAVAIAFAGFGDAELEPLRQYPITALLGLAMGMQSASARKIAVPDLNTTVVTMTLSALAVDSPPGAGHWVRPLRRIGAVFAMLGGGFAGAWLVLHAGPGAALSFVVVVSASAAVLAHALGRERPHWVNPVDS